MNYRRTGLLLAATALSVFAQAPQTPAAPNRPTTASQRAAGRNFLISRDVPDAAAVERGQKLFVAQCGFCHGSNANGGETGPDLIRSPLALDDEGGDKIGPVILAGRPDKGMPAFHLTQVQIKDVAAFLRSRQQAAIDRGAYTIQNIVTGDASKGQAFFKSHCSSCHSPTGDLAGIANKFDPVTLQGRFIYPVTRGRQGARPAMSSAAIPHATVTTASGQKVSGIVEYMDDFDIGIRDSSGEYHGFTRSDALRVEINDPLAKHEELVKQYTDADMHNILAYLETLK